MRAEILSIGDELTSGNRLDTNSQWISQQLSRLGISTVFHTTVGDSFLDNLDAFRHAAGRADIVISTGGLGPTADDLTREVIASAFDRPLELRQDAMAHIASLFAARSRPMPERNRVQAMFPAGSIVIPNPHGSAPGIDLSVIVNDRQSRIFALPGVPAEMKEMYVESVESTLIRELGAGKQRWFYRELKVFGIGESDVEQLMPDLIARDRDPIVGITVSKATITLRIAARCESEEEFLTRIAPTEQAIQEKLGLLIFGSGDSELDDAVAKLLDEKKLKLGVIELGAGVWIAPALSKHQTTDPEFGLVAARWYPFMPDMVDLPDMVASALEASINSGSALRDESVCNAASSVKESNNDGPSNRFDRLEDLASRMLASEKLDLCLAVGSYPAFESIQQSDKLPRTGFQMVLVRGGKEPIKKEISLGAHPEVLYHRLAKTALNLLRTELIEGD